MNEKELVNKLVLDLQENFGVRYITRELRSGNNIADVVYATDINRNNIVFDEYFNACYYFDKIYSHEKISIEDTKISDEMLNKKFHRFLKRLEKLGYIQINGDYIVSIKKVDAVTKNLVAIEAKISDWKAGLEQAMRYKQYANEVYVALSSEYISKVDVQQFKDLNIGLMSVSSEELKILIRAEKQPVDKLDIQYYIADRFLKQLIIQNTL